MEIEIQRGIERGNKLEIHSRIERGNKNGFTKGNRKRK